MALGSWPGAPGEAWLCFVIRSAAERGFADADAYSTERRRAAPKLRSAIPPLGASLAERRTWRVLSFLSNQPCSENRPNELSPQRVGSFLAVAVVVVRWVLVAGGAVGAGRVDAGSDFVLSSASLWVDMRRWLLRYSWLYVSVVGSPGAWKS